MIFMPRKPLMSSGESHRVNFRATDEVKDILDGTPDKSKFIREAVKFYWDLKNYTVIPSREINGTRQKPDKNEQEEVINKRWNPPWMRK